MSTVNKPGGCDETASKLLTVDEARQRIMDSVDNINGNEKLNIRQALDRVLDQDIISSINVPPYDNSAMDGYAIKSTDIPSTDEQALEVIGKAFAGNPFEGKLSGGQAIRIMTGAMIPEGADTIVMQEHARTEGSNIIIGSGHRVNDHVRRAGEDMRTGETILQPGKKLGPAELGLMASLGIGEVYVKRKLRVTFFSTGDELRSVGEVLEEGQIYDSNRYTLFGMLKQLGVELIDMGVIPDDRDAIRNAFNTAAEISDAIITSGGVSVGEADYVKDTLDELGQVNFWRVAMKPGKPLAIGTIKQAAFFGAPGNPVSAMATFYQFIMPALKKMMGMTDTFKLSMKLSCQTTLKKAPGRLEFQRGVMQYNDVGELVVSTTGVQGSHILTSMSKANCFIILPTESTGVQVGELVEVQPFSDLV